MIDFSPMRPIQERWLEVFGEPLEGVGFEVFPDQAPLLERCLEAQDRSEFDEYLERLNADGHLIR